ncbi:MAG: MBL fold metallo-hydrolase [Clostridia bacterium]|nr:MBL fold metallo-hydrolase [Clostridia bacterium]
MKLQFLGAAHEVTGSCTLLETKHHRILIDCGMEQGADIYENAELPLPAGEIDAVLLTHAHIDHSGHLPMLVAQGFSGPIYTTGATAALCRIMLMDSAHIQEFEAEWRNRKAKRNGEPPYEPLYTVNDAQRTLSLLQPCNYGKPCRIFEDVTVCFSDAGHLLGSASIAITITEEGDSKTLLFSGDLGNVSRPLIRDPQAPPAADFVVIESTYGDRLHGERPDYIGHLSRVLQRTFDRGGNVVIPSFAVGRTQELLYLIRQIKKEGLVTGHGDFPVWVDSPLAVEATNIYSGDLHDYYDEETLALLAQGENPIRFPGLQVSITSDDSRRINEDPTPKVILSASGMCEAGRIRHHIKHNLWRPESTILFVGYQSNGTLGRKIVDGAPTVKLFGEEIQVRAHIETLEGISGHADKDMLLGWLKKLPTPPKQVFVNHGEDSVCEAFAAAVRQELQVEALAPYNGAVYDLTNGECLQAGNTTRMAKRKKHADSGENPVFLRLLSMGRRLMGVIEKNRGGTNKDLARFAEQVQSLCDKWDR